VKRTFYEKQGRRYVPVLEYNSELMDALPEGAHLVMTRPGGQSCRYNIEPALAPMIAAGRTAEDAMVNAIAKATEIQPSTKVLTEKQQAAWQQITEAYGPDRFYLTSNSAYDVAQAGIEAMQQEAQKLLSHPTVREAYEHFLFVAKLVNDADKETK
jgi:hypothetical protein